MVGKSEPTGLAPTILIVEVSLLSWTYNQTQKWQLILVHRREDASPYL